MTPKPSDTQSPFAKGDGYASTMTPSPQSGVGREMHDLAADLEDVVTATTAATGAELARVKAGIGRQLEGARAAIGARARRTATATDALVRANPWRAVGYSAAAGAVVGLLLGVLVARR